MKKINWLQHGIELLVVIIGISIAFGLNNWRDNRKSRQEEYELLVHLLEDLNRDAETLTYILGTDSVKARHLDSLIGFAYTMDSAPAQKVFQYFINNNYYIPYKSEQITYSIMTSTGGLNLMKDTDLRRSVVQYYSQIAQELLLIDEALELHTMNYTVDYFVKEIRFVGPRQVNKSFLEDPVFRNIIFGQQSLLKKRMNSYRKTLQSVNKLKAEIEAYL